MAKIYLGMPHDLLKDVVETSNLDQGLDLMHTAAHLGDREAMLFLAQAYQSGQGLGSDRYNCDGGFVNFVLARYRCS